MCQFQIFLTSLFLSLPFVSGTAQAGETYGPVRTGDSLWLISRDHRPAATVTINQMMIATFRSNTDAFGGNINWLYVDRVLALPGADDVRAIPVAEADAEVLRQNQAWQSAVTRFVAVDAGRRQQLNTVISGQPSDDPEIRALREELRALVAGLKEDRKALQEERYGSREEQASPHSRFFDWEKWSFGATVGRSLSNPVVDTRARPRDSQYFQYHSYQFDSDGSSSNLGLHFRRPLWGAMEDLRLTLGVEYSTIAGEGRIVATFDHPIPSAGIPVGSYDQRFRRDTDVALLRLPVLLDTVLWTSSGETELVAGGGIVINRTLDVSIRFTDELTNLATGETSVESGPSHPLYDDVTSEGLSYDLRVFAGLRWVPEWTGSRPVWAGLEIEHSLGDPFGGQDVDHNLVKFEKMRFLMKLGIDF